MIELSLAINVINEAVLAALATRRMQWNSIGPRTKILILSSFIPSNTSLSNTNPSDTNLGNTRTLFRHCFRFNSDCVDCLAAGTGIAKVGCIAFAAKSYNQAIPDFNDQLMQLFTTTMRLRF